MKRAFDIAVGLLALIVLFVPMTVIAIMVRWRLGSPIFFRQERPGRGGKPFVLVKFRTMKEARDSKGELLPDGERLTSFGRFLRRASLDELPELWNVLAGDMSLVGPRPLLMSYLPYFTEREQLRHTVRPGITGWAQVNGRNEISWDRRLALDVWYVENWSLGLDLQILLRTLFAVVRRDGVAVNTDEKESNLKEEREKRMGRAESAPPDSAAWASSDLGSRQGSPA